MYLFKIFSYLFKYFPIINVDLAINNELYFFFPCNATDFVRFVYILLCYFLGFAVVGHYAYKFFSLFCDIFYCTTNLCCYYFFWPF
jgi:hypothetical protein